MCFILLEFSSNFFYFVFDASSFDSFLMKRDQKELPLKDFLKEEKKISLSFY